MGWLSRTLENGTATRATSLRSPSRGRVGPREGIMNKINLGFWRINKWRARSRIKRVPIIAGAWSRARKVPISCPYELQAPGQAQNFMGRTRLGTWTSSGVVARCDATSNGMLRVGVLYSTGSLAALVEPVDTTSVMYQLHQSSSTLPCPPHEVPDSTWCLRSMEMLLAI